MDSEAKMDKYKLMAKGLRGRAVADLVATATRETGLYVFGDLFDVKSVKELAGTDLQWALQLLELFAYGTWPEYREANGSLPALDSEQQLKLKQLTAVTLAQSNKTIGYDELMAALDISNVRQLEDLLITHCFYTGLIKGRLDQKGRCLHVHECAPRDVRPSELPDILAAVHDWSSHTLGVLMEVDTRMQWAQRAADAAEKQQAALQKQLEEVKGQSSKADVRSSSGPFPAEPGFRPSASKKSRRKQHGDDGSGGMAGYGQHGGASASSPAYHRPPQQREASPLTPPKH